MKMQRVFYTQLQMKTEMLSDCQTRPEQVRDTEGNVTETREQRDQVNTRTKVKQTRGNPQTTTPLNKERKTKQDVQTTARTRTEHQTR